MNRIYTAATLDKCIEDACMELKIEKNNLVFKVLEDKRGLFKKTASIDVEIPEERSIEKYDNNYNGTVSVIDGRILIKNPSQGGKPACISFSNGIYAKLNGNSVSGSVSVSEKDVIEVSFESTQPDRKMNIDVSPDKMEAYLSIIYVSGKKYKLKDFNEKHMCSLETEIIESIEPQTFTYREVEQEIHEKNITFGIIEKNIESNLKSGCLHILIAKGTEVMNGRDDSINVKFDADFKIPRLEEDDNGNVDFKSIGSIDGVNDGDIIAEKIEGYEGTDGKNIFGQIVKAKPMKKLKLKSGVGCTIKDDKAVVSIISGKPCIKNNVFYVYKVHEIAKDVDISTGNIKFIGDIIVYGSVKEGMELSSGNSTVIYKDVERANILSGGDVTVGGNIIAAAVTGGGQDVVRLRLVENISKLKENIENLLEMVSEVKKFNLLGQDRRDGEIIKLLIDSRFKSLTRVCLSIISDINFIHDDMNEDALAVMIKNKLMGLAPINIKHQSELNDVVDCLKEKLEVLTKNLSLPVKVKISYCQDSNIQSSGDVVITGQGEYVSSIVSGGSVIFESEKSVARGGRIKAKDKIQCKMVGSTAGVTTRLEVEKDGHIYADIAYHNTVIVIDNKEYVLESDSKNLHAYLHKEDDSIMVDKFML